MGFNFEPALNFLDIKEPVLYELYQSVKPSIPLDRKISEKESEAYICSEKEKNMLKVYLAFRDISAKTIRIYTPQSQPRLIREYEECIDAARCYMEQLGFSMNQVKLDYSTAMRQVIWGTVQVFKAPRPLVKSARGEKTLNPDPAEKIAEKPVEQSVAALEPVAPVIVAPPVSHTENDTENSHLLPELEQSRDEVKRLNKKINILQHVYDEEKKYLEAEISSVKNQMAMSAEFAESEKASRESENSGEILRLSAELDQEKARCAELADEVLAGKELNANAIIEFERLLNVAVEQKEIVANELQSVIEEKNRIEQVATAGLDSARIDRQELVAKYEESEQKQLRAIEELRISNAELVITLQNALTETERVKRELLINKRVAARERAGLRAELRRLVEERTLLGDEDLLVEINEGSHEIPTQLILLTPPVIPPVQINAEGDTYESPLQLARINSLAEIALSPDFSSFEVSPDAGLIDPEARPEPEFPSSFSFETEEAGTMAVYSGSDGDVTEFKPERQLITVPFNSPDDLYVLYESANKVQAVPDGFRVQRSGGYVCAVNHGGKREVYLVWQMLESNQTQLYAPTDQPVDEQAFQKVLQDALYYFDSIGFMMSQVDLSGSTHRLSAMDRMGLSVKQ